VLKRSPDYFWAVNRKSDPDHCHLARMLLLLLETAWNPTMASVLINSIDSGGSIKPTIADKVVSGCRIVFGEFLNHLTQGLSLK
jgi:hypothetical protein